jgi:hypothetical protein
MKIRALQDTVVRPVVPVSDPPQARPAAPPTTYAAVEARDPQGRPARIAMPAPAAAERTPLYVQHWSGGPRWAGDITVDGEVLQDPMAPCERELDLIRPGVKLLAPTDSRGRIVAVMAQARMPAPGSKPRLRASRTVVRSAAEPYAVDPNELLYSGAVGRVLRVG